MKYMNNHCSQQRIFTRNRLKLQLFAEGEGGSGEGDGGGSGQGSGGEGAGSGDEPLSFDDFLKEEGNQTEFDRRVREAVSAAVGEAKKKWELITDDKVSEAEKLAKMTKEERAEYQQQKERRDFEAEKAEFEKEKLLVEVKKQLQEQSLPIAFADSLVNISDAKEIKDAITVIKEIWDMEIAEAIKAKARQNTPPEGGHSAGNSHSVAGIREMAQKNRIIKN